MHAMARLKNFSQITNLHVKSPWTIENTMKHSRKGPSQYNERKIIVRSQKQFFCS